MSGRCLPIRFCLERLAEDENRSCIQMEEGGERVQRDSPRKTGEERAGPFDLQHAFACSHPRAFTIRDGMLADFIISPARAKNHGPRKARKGCRAVPSLCLRAIADSSISCGWADAYFQHQRLDLLAVPAGSDTLVSLHGGGESYFVGASNGASWKSHNCRIYTTKRLPEPILQSIISIA